MKFQLLDYWMHVGRKGADSKHDFASEQGSGGIPEAAGDSGAPDLPGRPGPDSRRQTQPRSHIRTVLEFLGACNRNVKVAQRHRIDASSELLGVQQVVGIEKLKIPSGAQLHAELPAAQQTLILL
jgi:hypothetical protein